MTSLPDITSAVHEIMRSVLERDVDPAVDVFDQGATSLAFIRAVARISEKYGITVDVSELEEASVDSLAELVARQIDTTATATAGV